MRREKKKFNAAKFSFLFFWKGCESCEKEICLQSVWKFRVSNYSQGFPNMHSNHIVCDDCCTTIDEANHFAKAFAKVKSTITPTPMPKCRPPKPEGPPNEIFGKSRPYPEMFAKEKGVIPDNPNPPNVPEPQGSIISIDGMIHPDKPWPRS